MRPTSAFQHLLAKIAQSAALWVAIIQVLLMAASAMSQAANPQITATLTARKMFSRLTSYQVARSTYKQEGSQNNTSQLCSVKNWTSAVLFAQIRGA